MSRISTNRWRPVLTIVVVIATVMVSSIAYTQTISPVVFAREKIVLHIDQQFLRVEGDYVFRNTTGTDQTQPLFYPFPVDTLHPYPGFISVRHGDRTLPFDKRAEGVGFSVKVPADTTTTVRVIYEQECYDNSGCYILTSTSAWKRPLESAVFEVNLAGGIHLEWSAYDLSPSDETAAGRTLGFARENFLPDKDLCLRWKTQK